MKWTQQHSENAVAAKRRKRMAKPDLSSERVRKIRTPRSKARFQITIRDLKIGDSLTLSLHSLPWRGRWFLKDGLWKQGERKSDVSTREVLTVMKCILNNA
jgi:hypothetical protein